MAEKKTEQKMNESKQIVGTRGRTFQGTVTKIFGRRAVIEFERTVKVQKYERFMRKNTRLHSRIPETLKVSVGDYVKVQECRPLSKIIHSVIVEVIRKAEQMEEKQ